MILDFFENSINLKKIQRQGWMDKLSMGHPESVSDHSYSVAIMCMVISDMQNLNSEKILKMALLHDLAESQIGDFTPDQIEKEEKKKIENIAFEKITKCLPEQVKIKYLEIWKDYQENISEESKIVHQIDKLEMVLQAKRYQKEGYDKEKLQQFFDSAKEEITNSQLKELFTQIINEK